MASLYFVTFPLYHMYPKDFTIDCIINTVPEPAPLHAPKRFVGAETLPGRSRAI